MQRGWGGVRRELQNQSICRTPTELDIGALATPATEGGQGAGCVRGCLPLAGEGGSRTSRQSPLPLGWPPRPALPECRKLSLNMFCKMP